MTPDDLELDQNQQALATAIQRSFGELNLSSSQRRLLSERFAAGMSRRAPSGGVLVARSTGVHGSDVTGHRSTAGAEISPPRRTRLTRGLELAAILLVVALFTGGVLVARTLIPSGNTPHIAAPSRSVTTVYAIWAGQSTQRLTPLDPMSLTDQASAPVTLSSPDWAVSPNGSTVVTIEFDQTGAIIVVRDGFTGSQLRRFRSPVQRLLSPVSLSRDGSRLLVRQKIDSSQWSVIDTNDGRLLASFTLPTPSYPFATMMSSAEVQLSPDGTRLFQFVYGTASGGTMPLRINAFDVETGQPSGSISLPDVQVGTWQEPQAGASEPLTIFQEPGIAFSSNGREMAVVTPDGRTIELIDTQRLAVERTIHVTSQTGLVDRALRALGLRAGSVSAKELNGALRYAVFSADDGALYIWGATYSTSDSALHSGSLTRIDLASGANTTQQFPNSSILQVQPAPDGKSLYVAGNEFSTDPATDFIRRLDARSLQTLAERSWDESTSTFSSFVLVTAESQASQSTP